MRLPPRSCLVPALDGSGASCRVGFDPVSSWFRSGGSARAPSPPSCATNPEVAKPVQQLDSVVVRFAGDSGDGMQLTGGRFTSETAILGNDLSTFPDFPAEIRAPAGSLPGVSGFQVHF